MIAPSELEDSHEAMTILRRETSRDAAAPLLEKPWTPDELARRVREVLDGDPAA